MPKQKQTAKEIADEVKNEFTGNYGSAVFTLEARISDLVTQEKEEAVELLKKLKYCYLQNLDANMEPKMPILEMLKLWDDVNTVIKKHDNSCR